MTTAVQQPALAVVHSKEPIATSITAHYSESIATNSANIANIASTALSYTRLKLLGRFREQKPPGPLLTSNVASKVLSF